MAVITEYLRISTRGDTDVVDITSDVNRKLQALKIKNGVVNINVCGSTAAVTTCEFEPGLVQDIKDIFNKMIPSGRYHHYQAWGDGTGHAHLRSSLVGSSVSFPFNDRKLILGTWQQIIFIDFDNRARDRQLVLQFVGE